MFKNPYLLPVIGLVVLGILFTVQRKQSSIAESDAPVEVLLKPVLVTVFKDPIAKNSLSGWEVGNGGYLGNAITFPRKGYVEFDVGTSGEVLLEKKIVFSLKKLNTNMELFALYVSKGCDSIGLSINNESKSRYFKGGCSFFPVRSRIEWNDTSLNLFVNGRFWISLPPVQHDSAFAVRPFVLHSEDSGNVNNLVKISDLRLYKQ